MSDASYYENEGLWRPERYESADERARFAACLGAVPPESTSLLDVGCGNGAFLAVSEESGRFVELRGLERARSAIEARVCASPIDPGDSAALPYSADSYDTVVALEVLEHLPVPVYRETVRELGRVAHYAIVITVPYRERLTKVECPACGCRFHPHRHVRSFDERAVRSLIPGWVAEEVRVLDQEDYLFGNVLRRAYVALRGRDDMTPTAVCPQCGFTPTTGELSDPPSLASTRQRLRSTLRGRLPGRRRPAWWLARYRPYSPQASAR